MLTITYSATAIKAFDKLSRARRGQIKAKIDAVAAGERADVRKLIGQPGYRVRVGSYRVIVEIEGENLLVQVIATRGQIY